MQNFLGRVMKVELSADAIGLTVALALSIASLVLSVLTIKKTRKLKRLCNEEEQKMEQAAEKTFEDDVDTVVTFTMSMDHVGLRAAGQARRCAHKLKLLAVWIEQKNKAEKRVSNKNRLRKLRAGKALLF